MNEVKASEATRLEFAIREAPLGTGAEKGESPPRKPLLAETDTAGERQRGEEQREIVRNERWLFGTVCRMTSNVKRQTLLVPASIHTLYLRRRRSSRQERFCGERSRVRGEQNGYSGVTANSEAIGDKRVGKNMGT